VPSALAAAALAIPAAAAARVEASNPLSAYAQARVAASEGALDRASAGFAAALAIEPDNEVVASQALTHAVTAGNWPLALRAARTLERGGHLLPDARFLLVADAFRARDWRLARRQIDAVEQEQLFAFAVPVLRAWLAHGSRDGDPLAFLQRASGSAAAEAYAAEHRPLLLLAAGRREGRAALLERAADAGPRGTRLRLAGAATLARRRDREQALALLEGDDAALAAARRLVERRRPLPGAVGTASEGVAELMVKLALDMHSEDLSPVAVSFARIATFLAPENSQAWLVTAELLAQEDRHEAAIGLLDNVAPDDPFAPVARDQRIRLLVEKDQGARALSEAQAAAGSDAASVADLVRFAQVLMDEDRPAEAAQVFARAIERRAATGEASYAVWSLWVFRGGAHDEADDWPQARAALQEAYRLAPDQPLVLNYLGYAQLERRENLVEAERLVREAHRLAPDNPAITDSLGWALFLKGDLAEAIALLEQAAEGGPADVEINEHLGDAYFTGGRRVEARFAWAAARIHAEGEDAARLDAKMQAGLTPQLAAR
jgi:tetratricopeptide (TPR) repeat protein